MPFYFQILSEIVWEEVKNQLPEDINESADCPDKEKYATLFKAVKVSNNI